MKQIASAISAGLINRLIWVSGNMWFSIYSSPRARAMNVALASYGNSPADLVIYLLCGDLRLIRLVNQDNFSGVAAGQIKGDGATDATRPARYNGNLVLYLRQPLPLSAISERMTL